MPNTTTAETGDMPGRNTETTLEDTLTVFDTREDRAEPLTAPEIANALDCSRRTALNKLNELEERGEIKSKQVGGRSKVFWTEDRGAADDGADAEMREDERRDDMTVDDHGGVPGTTDPMLDADDEFAQLVNDVADEILPGSGTKLEARREALHAIVEYLREHETAEPKDFKRDVYPAHNGQYTTGDDPARSWWKNAMSKGLKELAERTDAVEKASSTGEWSYQSDRDE